MRVRKALFQGLSAVAALILSIALGTAMLMEGYKVTIDTALGTTSELLESKSTDDEPLYERFKPSSDVLNSDGTANSHALIQKAIDLNRKQAAEGAVLLKNQTESGQGLPLKEGSKLSLLGIRSAISMLGSSFGLKLFGPCITLEQALTQNKTDFANTITTMENNDRVKMQVTSVTKSIASWSGDEFEFDGAGMEVNPTLLEMYTKLNETYNHANCEMTSQTYDPREPSQEEMAALNSDYTASLANYNDAAIVVIARPAAEGIDYLPGGVADGLGAIEPLALTKNELDNIELAKKSSDNVIVILNTANPVELAGLENDPEIDAILWIGFPGAYGMLGVADILSGKVSPSGALPDTYAAYNLSAPAMQNMGDFSYANTSDVLTRTSSMFGAGSSTYVVEAEGLYVGYRYYETRYFDAVLGQGNASSSVGAYASSEQWKYEDEVVYPFGYGLSYTTFTQELLGEPTYSVEADSTTGATNAYATFEVRVTNTGTRAGKSIVQIYGQAPYTPGGIEKSAIQLMNFEKSKELAPGESEVVSVTCDLQYIASYDSNHTNADGSIGSYIIEPGTYWFGIGNGAHDALNNIMAAQGIEASRLTGASDASLALSKDIDQDFLSEDAFSLSKTGYQVSNQIPYADLNYYQPGTVTYLSRADWAGTYPKTYDSLELTSQDLIDDLNGKYYSIKTDDDTSDIAFGQTSDVKFWDLAGKDFDDPLFEQALGTMTLEETLYLATFGGPSIPSVSSLGLTEHYLTENAGNGIVVALNANKDPDAPWAVSASDPNSAWNPAVFGNAPLTAASFNNELFYELGEFIGEESLFTGISILWGPGLNTHRHAYNGRNGEYYSEDPILCGNAAMEFAIGALEYGLIAAPKHFAFNDQETNRSGIAPYMTEQRAREVELRAYQVAFEASKYDTADNDAGMRGLMTSFSKIGGVECTASTGLMTEILKNEWGFKGYAVTDIYDDTDLWASVLVSGTTCFDTRGMSGFYSSTSLESSSVFANQVDGSTIGANSIQGDATVQKAAKESAHNVLYAMTQSNLMNRYNSTSHMVQKFTWWRGVYGTVIALSALAMVVFAVLALKSTKRPKDQVK